MQNSFMLIKIKRSRRLFENQSEIKTIWEKIGILKFIWKIGVSKIIWKSEFWKLNLRIRILDIKFTRNLILDIEFEKNEILEIKFERNQNFWKLNLKEIGIPEIKFEKD